MDAEPPRGHRWSEPARWLAIVAAVVLLVGGSVILLGRAIPDRRPVVLSVYCTSSAVWMTTLAPLLEPPPRDDEQRPGGRVTSARLRAAYERRCPTAG